MVGIEAPKLLLYIEVVVGRSTKSFEGRPLQVGDLSCTESPSNVPKAESPVPFRFSSSLSKKNKYKAKSKW